MSTHLYSHWLFGIGLEGCPPLELGFRRGGWILPDWIQKPLLNARFEDLYLSTSLEPEVSWSMARSQRKAHEQELLRNEEDIDKFFGTNVLLTAPFSSQRSYFTSTLLAQDDKTNHGTSRDNDTRCSLKEATTGL